MKRATFAFTAAATAITTAGLLAGASPSAEADVLGFTNATFSPNPGTGDIDDTSQITSFTTSAGTTSDLGGTEAATVTAPDSNNDPVRNYWASNANEIEGGASITTGNGLDVGHGVINMDTGDFLFGQTLNDGGADGNANDIFFTDIGGGDGVTVVPLDSSGTAIGDFTLTVPDSAVTSSGTNISFSGDNSGTGGSNFSGANASLAGVAFDVADFSSTTVGGSPTGVAGVQITDSDGAIDPGVVGYNLNAVPEPASLALLGLGGLLVLPRRRRKA